MALNPKKINKLFILLNGNWTELGLSQINFSVIRQNLKASRMDYDFGVGYMDSMNSMVIQDRGKIHDYLLLDNYQNLSIMTEVDYQKTYT